MNRTPKGCPEQLAIVISYQWKLFLPWCCRGSICRCPQNSSLPAAFRQPSGSLPAAFRHPQPTCKSSWLQLFCLQGAIFVCGGLLLFFLQFLFGLQSLQRSLCCRTLRGGQIGPWWGGCNYYFFFSILSVSPLRVAASLGSRFLLAAIAWPLEAAGARNNIFWRAFLIQPLSELNWCLLLEG